MLKRLARYGVILGALSSAPLLQAADDEIIAPTRIENVRVRDGVTIAVAIYLPNGAGRYPTLFAASPYRFDNNLLPPTLAERERTFKVTKNSRQPDRTLGPISRVYGPCFLFTRSLISKRDRSGSGPHHQCE